MYRGGVVVKGGHRRLCVWRLSTNSIWTRSGAKILI